jgi:hypothetical protein
MGQLREEIITVHAGPRRQQRTREASRGTSYQQGYQAVQYQRFILTVDRIFFIYSNLANKILEIG